jgi:hypothetical protein
MSVTFQFEGLEELKAALRTLPDELTAEAQAIVELTANQAAAEIQAAYPARTGNLKDRVFVTHFDNGRFRAGAIVKNTAKHAYIFENGTQARHTAIGANRGSMPPGHVFIPRMIRARRRMWEGLRSLLERAGLVVSSDVAA